MINMTTNNLGHLELHQLGHDPADQTFEFISSPRIRRLEHTASAAAAAAAAAMECPRCGSINTKFCYYNNYSKTQPRHFCKACKRHWTKGGTLRNIPIGGGAARKNKRQKINNKAAAAAVAVVASCTDTKSTDQTQQRNCDGDTDHLPPLSEFPSYQSTDHPLLDNLGSGSFVSFGTGLLDLSQQQQFSFSIGLSSFENNNNPSSLSTASTFDIQSSADTYNYADMINGNSMEDSNMMASAFIPQPWPNCWNLEDIDTLVSSQELNIPNWDDPPLV